MLCAARPEKAPPYEQTRTTPLPLSRAGIAVISGNLTSAAAAGIGPNRSASSAAAMAARRPPARKNWRRVKSAACGDSCDSENQNSSKDRLLIDALLSCLLEHPRKR